MNPNMASHHAIAEAMAHFGIRDAYENLKRLGEFMRYSDAWFAFLERQLEQLELEEGFTLIGKGLQRRGKIGPDGAVVTF